jgi:hypothetical protein
MPARRFPPPWSVETVVGPVVNAGLTDSHASVFAKKQKRKMFDPDQFTWANVLTAGFLVRLR